jgi:hypothetical protein
MEEVDVRTASGSHEACEQGRHEQPQPGTAAQVPEDAVAVRDPEVVELLGPDDLDADAARAHAFHGIRDETTRGVARAAWIRGRQHADPHHVSTRKTA